MQPYQVIIQKSFDWPGDRWIIDIKVEQFQVAKSVEMGPEKLDYAVDVNIELFPPIQLRWTVTSEWLMDASPMVIFQSFEANEDLRIRMQHLTTLRKDVRDMCAQLAQYGALAGNYPPKSDQQAIIPEIIGENQQGHMNIYGKVKDRMPEAQKPLVELCPAIEAIVEHPVEKGQRMPLGFVIMNLNDHHEWTRDRVADWLETLDLNINIEVQDDAS